MRITPNANSHKLHDWALPSLTTVMQTEKTDDSVSSSSTSVVRSRLAASLLLCCFGVAIEFLTAFSRETAFSLTGVGDAFQPPQPQVDAHLRLRRDPPKNVTRPDTIDPDSFSACLLVMDENHRLVEWIAYHYYALNLRYLIIAVDPKSTEEPTDVLDRWRDKMIIEEWNDRFYLSTEERMKVARGPENQALSNHFRHRVRQRLFYKRCGARLKRKGRRWTAMYDVDEYFAINSKLVNGSSEMIATPGHVQIQLDKLRNEAATLSNTSLIGYHFGKECILLPRIVYGHTESSDEDIQSGVPSYLDPSRFDTLRWRHRTTLGTEAPTLAKAIVDVSQLPEEDLAEEAFGNTHRPFQICTKSSPWVTYKLPVGLLHYIGSWQQYNYRKKDARQGLHDRRGRKVWMDKGSASVSVDDEIRPWISGFVNFFGNDTATVLRLLNGAGLPSERSEAFRSKQATR